MTTQSEKRVHQAKEKLEELHSEYNEATERRREISEQLSERLAAVGADDEDGEDVSRLRSERADLKSYQEDLENAIEITEDTLQEAQERVLVERFKEADEQAAERAEESAGVGLAALRRMLDAIEAYREWKREEREADRAWQSAKDLYREIAELEFVSPPEGWTASTSYEGNPEMAGNRRARQRLDLHQRSARRTAMTWLEKLADKMDRVRRAEAADSIAERLGLQEEQ